MNYSTWKMSAFLSAFILLAAAPAAHAQATTEMTTGQARSVILAKFANIVDHKVLELGNGLHEDWYQRITAVRVSGHKVEYDLSWNSQGRGFSYHPAPESGGGTKVLDLQSMGPVFAIVGSGWAPASHGRRGGTFTVAADPQFACAGYCLINQTQSKYVDSALMWTSEQDARSLAQALNRLATSGQTSAEMAAWSDFQQKAAAWRALPAKPALDSQADRHWVLAENAVKEKNLDSAIEHYQEALAIQPMWPTGWFDLAMVYGEQNSYDDASDAMKHYLELVPNASDAKAARDQIIIWEDKAKQ
jgi:tetratricopeptide (TPR) repeat protein